MSGAGGWGKDRGKGEAEEHEQKVKTKRMAGRKFSTYAEALASCSFSTLISSMIAADEAARELALARKKVAAGRIATPDISRTCRSEARAQRRSLRSPRYEEREATGRCRKGSKSTAATKAS